MRDLAERLHRLFAGLDRVHGWYDPKATPAAAGQKAEGGADTRKRGATADDWLAHLEGRTGLGIVPIRDDATCVFGAIDVDDYTVDHVKLVARVAQLKLPLIVARTKSGGAHLYVFTSEATPAELVRAKLMEWAVALGHSGVEIFPKQTRLAGKNDNGSWLNMPYLGPQDRGLRYALDAEGRAHPVEKFVELAEARRLTHAELAALELPPEATAGDLLADGPPCLQTLALRGFPQGTRNNSLFNVAVYLKKRWPDDWEARVDDYNQRLMIPPLGHTEVAMVVRGARKKDYAYRCKDQPIAGVCNKQICLTRQFGIGGASDDPGVTFGTLIKLETVPPTWLWDVNGARLELTTEELLDQRAFRKTALERLSVLTNLIRAPAWTKLLSEKLERLEVRAVPKDVTPGGQWRHHLEDFCGQRAQARTEEEVLLGKPWKDEARKIVAFRAVDFSRYLQDRRVTGVEPKEIYGFLREIGAAHRFLKIKGRGTNLWEVGLDRLEAQTEGFEVPRKQAGEF